MTTKSMWLQMIARCYDPKHEKYPRYGGRGIRVCDRWICHRLFAEDMGPRPEGKSLNRIDNDGDYCPENCEWAGPFEQAQNQSTNRNITFNGETNCITKWERITGISRKTISKRLKNGWTIQNALTVPPSKNNQHLEHTYENYYL